MKALLTSLTILALVGSCSENATPQPDSVSKDAVVVHDLGSADGAAVDGPVVDGPVVDGPVVDGPVVDGPVVDGPAVDLQLDTQIMPDTQQLDGKPADGTACVTEGNKFTDFNTVGKCCGTLVPVVDAIPNGQGGCSVPKCPCYVCTKCGDSTCGIGENYCNCPQDCPTISASMVDEVWYQGDTSCTPASMKLAASKGKITVTLSQIPMAQVPGTCKGHSAAVIQTGATLQLSLNQTGGGACWTACWDFTVEITGLPPGSYTVSYLSFTDTIAVP